MKTCRAMNIRTVAVHSEVDKHAKHVQWADEAVNLGGTTSAESYLVLDKILEACKMTGAQAVHPGYGFLSENRLFPEILEKNGIVFIGPGVAAIDAMGDKIASKKLAKEAKVNTIPGYLGEIHSDSDAIRIAHEIGFPVMIKASAGGGGKGMRIAWDDKEVIEGFRLSKAEAKSAFGDDRLFVEKYIDNPRHIEIQVMFDNHGNGVYFPERECSIQRRNQKVIEESPSVHLDEKTRKAMGEQAVALGHKVGYRSAGTCEFLVDPNLNFYFLEMNTRLQVEHPVTEYITGQDLVACMIKVAAGEPLELKQSDIKITGHATECRVYAEDPYRNFLPSTGRLVYYTEPDSANGNVRCDSGVVEGSEISMFYDPLICKLITYGENRIGSIERMKRALDEYVIRGVNHNVPFLRSILEHPRYVKGALSTKFIPEEWPQGFKGHTFTEEQKTHLLCSAATMQLIRQQRASLVSLDEQLQVFEHPESAEYSIGFLGSTYDVHVSGPWEPGMFVVEHAGVRHEVNAHWKYESPTFEAKVGGKPVHIQVIKRETGGPTLQIAGTQVPVTIRTPLVADLFRHIPPPKVIDTSKQLISPMPGLVQNIAVSVGDEVGEGVDLMTIEAMKMQNVLKAERPAKVKAIKVKAGDSVEVKHVLIEFEQFDPPTPFPLSLRVRGGGGVRWKAKKEGVKR
eukprot:TRINITY_DN365_c0_g1_i1.p1 TRINITY_DN365_c0_g1~~TRINITY_DN365_c0_g1_i1.p1  ORF type:complete len:764 (+),score=166.73 TRINITY_DN365_c0_g1_i1:248-2293(+)